MIKAMNSRVLARIAGINEIITPITPMKKHNLFNRFVWLSMIAATGTSPLAVAQKAEPASIEKPEEPAKLEKFIVTGSQIKRIEGETALPVQMFTREDIDAQGIVSAEQLIMQ